MKLLYLFSLLLMNLFPPDKSAIIEGKVVEKNNQPVPQAYLFVVRGEEETISASTGKFSITTWQTFPVTLWIEHPVYKKQKIVIREPGAKYLIKLEQK